MKKALSVAALLMAILMLALCCAACGDEEKKDDATAAPTSAATDATAAPTDAVQPSEQATEASTEASTDANEASPLAGTYTVDDGDNKGTLTVKADGTAVLSDDYTTYDFTFDPATDAVKIVVYGTTLDGTYSFDGTNLTVTANGETITFTKSAEQATVDVADLAGSYKCIDVLSESGELTEDQIEQAKEAYVVEIKADGTATISAMGISVECVFDTATMTVKPTSTEGDPLPFTFDGKELRVSVSDENTLVFAKNE